jgi:hypothetical protein
MRNTKRIFVESYLYEAGGSLPVMPSLLPHVLWGRSQVSLFFANVVSPDLRQNLFDKKRKIATSQRICTPIIIQWEHFMYWIHISDWLLLHTENLDKQDINNTENLDAVFKYPDVGL